MLRIAPLFVWLTFLTLCLTGIIAAQGPTSRATERGSAVANASVATEPGTFQLAGAGSRSLVERLKAIRGETPQRSDASSSSRRTTATADAPSTESSTVGRRTDEYRISSRRTANRTAARPVAPPASGAGTGQSAPAVAPLGILDTANATTSGGVDAGPDLPSVLVRRGNRGSSAAPVTDVADLATAAPSQNLGDDFGTSSEPNDSARRTARRWRQQQTPSFQHATPDATMSRSPMTIGGSTSYASSSTGGGNLSLSGQGPTLRIETIGPKAVAVGKVATYRIRLVNQGSVAAHRVLVAATIPGSVDIVSVQSRFGSVSHSNDTAGGRLVTWNMDRVAASSQQELAIRLKPTENKPIELKVEWIHRPAPLSARIEVQQPQLAVNIDGPIDMRYGETKVFKIKLSNPGNGPAENVTVDISATGTNGEPNRVGTLAGGESRTLEVELTARQAGKMQIRVMARGDGSLQAQAAHEVHVRRAVLTVQVSAPGLLYAGTTASYKIRVANRGDAVAEGVIMQVEMPTGATNGIGVDKKPITLERPRWRIGDLSPGTERVYSMQCDLSVSGQNQLVARVQGADKSLLASDTALTTVEAIADLKLIVNDPKGPVPVGKDVVYEIKVLNRGSSEASNINLVAQFSEGIEPASTAGHRAEIVPGQVIFDPIAKIPAGQEVTLKVTARAAQSGNHRFRVELNCGTPETKLVAEESTRFYGGTSNGPSSTRSASRPTGVPTPAEQR